MNSASPFVIIEKSGEETIAWAARLLQASGLRIVRTFDLQEARLAHPDCPCPHHGTEACDCQMSVLLIYCNERPPASLLVHSFQETTWLHLVDTSQQPVDPKLCLLIKEVLAQPLSGLVEDDR